MAKLKEAADPSEFTQQTYTEAEILVSPEFVEVKNILEHRLLKPSEAVEISLPRNKWSIEAIGTLLTCLMPCAEGCGYSMDAEADDDSEYIMFENTRVEDDSEFNPLNLSVKELKAYAPVEFRTYSDAELEDGFRFYSDCLAKLSMVQDSKSKVLAEKTKTVVESILAVAYRRGLPWAVEEMHKTAAIGQA
jgi:hypothetical protein